jgi:hypothetical protein
MANFAAQEGTLNAGVAQTFDFKTKLGVNALSLVYSNDDASSTHTMVIDGAPLTVKPSEQRVFSGVQNWNTLVIGGDAGSTGAYRVYASSTLPAPVFYKPFGGPVTTAGLADGSVTDAKLAVGAHVASAGVVGLPYPTEVVVLDVADGADAASVNFTGLIGKHEILNIQLTFTAACANTDGYEVLNGTTTNSITTSAGKILGTGVAGATRTAGILQNMVLSSGDIIQFKRSKSGAASTAARAVITLVKVA